MKAGFKEALVLALERRTDPVQSQWLMFNAQVLPGLTELWRNSLSCEQGFRPEFLGLEGSQYQITPNVEVSDCDGAIVLVGRNRKVNERNILRAWNACKQDGSVLVSGDKTCGVASLRKWASGPFEIRKTGDAVEVPSLMTGHKEFEIAEGMFSSDGPDKGSILLAEHFDKRIKGSVADFGAGWGYLSNRLLRASENISELDLFEADYASQQAAKDNVKSDSVKLAFNWCDLTSEFKKRPRHWVIMNPPFHSGRAAEPELGKTFIQLAASTLPSGGRLLMVANRNLPYEDTLSKCFKRFETLETRDGFKVIEAVR